LISLLSALVLATTPAPSPAFALDSTWDKGKPEVVTYTTTSSQGSIYESRLAIRKGLTALKNVASLEMIYGEENKSVFARFDRARLSLIDIETASGDMRHTRVDHVRVQGNRMAARTEGELVVSLPSADVPALVYDVMPSQLRAYDLSTPVTFSAHMLPTQPSASLIPVEVVFYGREGRPSETSRGGLAVDVRHQGKTDHMWFHPGPGHVLLVWERPDGTTLTYKKSERRIYEEKLEVDFRGGNPK
jgi:hypothetical protein